MEQLSADLFDIKFDMKKFIDSAEDEELAKTILINNSDFDLI